MQPRQNFHWLGRNFRNFLLFGKHHFHHGTLPGSFRHLTSQGILQSYGRCIRPTFNRWSNSCSRAIPQQKTRLLQPAPGQPQHSLHSLPWRCSEKSRTSRLQEQHRNMTLQLLLLNLYLGSARVKPVPKVVKKTRPNTVLPAIGPFAPNPSAARTGTVAAAGVQMIMPFTTWKAV